VLLATLLVLVVATWNRLVRWRNHYRNAFSQIDVQLKRRHDLVPNLVEATRAYLQHERGTLEAVVAARAAATSASERAHREHWDPASLDGLAAAETALGGALGRLLAVVEAYPDLKADRTIAALSEEITSTENRNGFARQALNDAVTAYNTARELFPAVLLSAILGFAPARLLEPLSSPAVAAAPKVVLP